MHGYCIISESANFSTNTLGLARLIPLNKKCQLFAYFQTCFENYMELRNSPVSSKVMSSKIRYIPIHCCMLPFVIITGAGVDS